MKEIIIDTPKLGVRGEFRAVLRGPDGKIKQDNGWHENLITDGGMYRLMRTDANTPFDQHLDAWLGTGGGVHTPDMIDLFARVSEIDYSPIVTGKSNTGAPDYIRQGNMTYVFPPAGIARTIQEWGISSDGNPYWDPFCIMHNISPAINKGEFDELTIYYRYFTHFSAGALADPATFGIVDINGVDYSWEMKAANIDYIPTLPIGGAGVKTVYCYEGDWGATIEDAPYNVGGAFVAGVVAGAAHFNDLTDWWMEANITRGIDSDNGSTYKSFFLSTNLDRSFSSISSTAFGWQMHWGKTLEGGATTGSGLLKEDTHEFKIKFRTKITRYIP